MEIIYSGIIEKNKEEKRGREERRERVPSFSPLPHPLFFFAHISLHCPHNLNPWNRLLSHSLFPETTLAQFIIITSDFKIYTTVEPLFRGHPRDQGKCPLNRDGCTEVCQ